MAFGIGCLFTIALVTALPAQTKGIAAEGQGQMGMMADCQKMMADMKAGQEKLDALVAEMNAATGQEKVDRIATVLTELVARQKAMQAHMTMMGHGLCSARQFARGTTADWARTAPLDRAPRSAHIR
jgi:predicted oxidoreductase